MSRLENWGYLWNSIYANVYNDPRWEDGHYIKVSKVVDPEIGELYEVELYEGDIIKTKNSTYLLGKKQ